MRWLLFAFCWWCFVKPVQAVIEVSEVYANPPGDEVLGEFIELHNPAAETQDLVGYVLEDTVGTVTRYIFPTTLLSAGEYKVFYRPQTQISLNNDTEAVRLTAPTGIVATTPVFQSAEGLSQQKMNAEWLSSTPTPNQPPSTPVVTPTPSPSLTPAATPTSTPQVELWIPTPVPSLDPVAANIRLQEVAACASPYEWMEVRNTGDELSTTEWSIRDAQGNSKSLSGNTFLSHDLTLIRWKSGLLNNSGDTLQLLWGTHVVDEVEAHACTSQDSWQLLDGEWQTSKQPTPGQENGVSDQLNNNVATSAATLQLAVPRVAVASPIEEPESMTVPRLTYPQTEDFNRSSAGMETTPMFSSQTSRMAISRTWTVMMCLGGSLISLSQVLVWWKHRHFLHNHFQPELVV